MGRRNKSKKIYDMSSFEDACNKAKSFSVRPSDADLLKLYGLYKQATVGDNDTGTLYF
jgi:diazepam-binding inhibitor (GABA receptor modulating acyl-CoA-binding protein)